MSNPRTRRRKPAPPSTLEDAVKRDIAEVAERSPGVENTWAAHLATTLARRIELDDEQALAARATAAKVLAETMAALQATVSAEEEKDGLDQLAARRSARKAS